MHICPSFTQTTHGGPGYSQVGLLNNFPSVLYCRISEFILKMKLVTKRCRAVLRSKAAFMGETPPSSFVEFRISFPLGESTFWNNFWNNQIFFICVLLSQSSPWSQLVPCTDFLQPLIRSTSLDRAMTVLALSELP